MRNSYPIYFGATPSQDSALPFSVLNHQAAIEVLYVTFEHTLDDYELQDFDSALWSSTLSDVQQMMLGHHMAIDWLYAHPLPF